MLRKKNLTWKVMGCQKSWDSQFSWTCHLDAYTTDMPLDSGAPSWASAAADAIDMHDWLFLSDNSYISQKGISTNKDHTDRTPPKEKLPVSLILAQVLAAIFVLGRVSPITILIVTSTVQHNEFLSPGGTEKFAIFLVPTYFKNNCVGDYNVRFEILMMSWYYIYFPLYKFHFFNH